MECASRIGEVASICGVCGVCLHPWNSATYLTTQHFDNWARKVKTAPAFEFLKHSYPSAVSLLFMAKLRETVLLSLLSPYVASS